MPLPGLAPPCQAAEVSADAGVAGPLPEVDEPVHVVPHRPEWAEQGAELARSVAQALGPLARDVEHVGSTAVRGLVAKPVLDLAVAVDVSRWSSAVELLAGLGFQDLGEAGVASRRYLRRRFEQPWANVHLLEPGGPLWTDALLLRDHLRARPEAVERYAAAKLAAARQHTGLLDYSAAKAGAVQQALSEAREDRCP